MTYEANNLEVNYEVVKPEELNPKERANAIWAYFYATTKGVSVNQINQVAISHVKLTLRLPLIGSGRMQPENLSDLKYWKDVLSELEKM